jgi:uncharacterized phiE125 gp8 family phage protein
VEAYGAYLDGLVSVPVVTLDEAKKHLNVTRSDEDDMILGMVGAATEWVENYTGLTIGEREVSQGFRGFYDVRDLNFWPVTPGATATIAYVDASGVEQTVPGRLVTSLRPVRVYPAAGVWPSAATDQVIVTVTAGYSATTVPFSLKAAIKLMVGDLYANREIGVTGLSYTPTDTLINLCSPYRLPGIA